MCSQRPFCGASVIVTSNLKDFPPRTLAPHNITALQPDIIIRRLIDADTQGAVAAFAIDRTGMTMPPMTAGERRVGLATTVAALRLYPDDL